MSKRGGEILMFKMGFRSSYLCVVENFNSFRERDERVAAHHTGMSV